MHKGDVTVREARLGATTPSDTASVVVILPTYNEAPNVGVLLIELLACRISADVLVVDDGSPDGTVDVAEAVGRSCPGRVHVLRRATKDGLGPAYRAGFSWAFSRGYSVVVQMDADGSHPVEVLPDMLHEIERGADLVIGSRYVEGGGSVNWPASRRMLSRFGNGYARVLLGLPLHDVTSGYRCWRRDALKRVADLDPHAEGYGYLIEMVTAAHRSALQVAEVPIVFKNREMGRSKMSLGIALEAMHMVLQLRGNPNGGHGQLGAAVATQP